MNNDNLVQVQVEMNRHIGSFRIPRKETVTKGIFPPSNMIIIEDFEGSEQDRTTLFATTEVKQKLSPTKVLPPSLGQSIAQLESAPR